MPHDTAAPYPQKFGREVGLYDWVQVTQELVDQFADVTGDHQYIHDDRVAAAQTHTENLFDAADCGKIDA